MKYKNELFPLCIGDKQEISRFYFVTKKVLRAKDAKGHSICRYVLHKNLLQTDPKAATPIKV
jgi:hypothetical protein